MTDQERIAELEKQVANLIARANEFHDRMKIVWNQCGVLSAQDTDDKAAEREYQDALEEAIAQLPTDSPLRLEKRSTLRLMQ